MARSRGGEVGLRPQLGPSELDVDHLTLDLSHAATARQSSVELVRDWGERLRHVHLTDGTNGATDEHLLPGEGDQDAAGVLSELAQTRFDGLVVVEVKTRGLARAERRHALSASLAFAREHLTTPVEQPR